MVECTHRVVFPAWRRPRLRADLELRPSHRRVMKARGFDLAPGFLEVRMLLLAGSQHGSARDTWPRGGVRFLLQ
jgi:hypothetical protein